MGASSALGNQLPKLPIKRVVRPTPTIPDHQVLRQIGSGAYGEVWLAKSLTGAWRAVKIVWREDFDDERTFNREFEGILQYEPIARNHPGLVHILHVGRQDGEHPYYYYVMELGDDARTGVQIHQDEYVPRTLQTDKKLSGNKPLPLDYCLEIGSQLAHALLYLHSKNLTHRDIKPANVIFVNSRPKLADIGLVAHQDQRSFVGTEGFIPPDGPGTKRADVYALAKVLYEISTGKDRLDFPELPTLNDDLASKKWHQFNNIICQAAEPRVDECTIDSAELLAEQIDLLRGFEFPTKYRASKKKKKKSKQSFQLLTAAILGAVCSYFAVQFITPDEVPHPPVTQDTTVTPTAGNEQNTGYAIIITSPHGASIYDKNGNYIDETPYGPISLPHGTPVAYTIKKPGYADKEVYDIIRNGQTCVLGGALKQYHPPKDNTTWKDTNGQIYRPDHGIHIAERPISVHNFNKFINDTIASTPCDKETALANADAKESENALIHTKAIEAYVRWLNKQCEIEGLLGKDYYIFAESLPHDAENSEYSPYILKVVRALQVPITIHSIPRGASVFFNNKLIGRTPLEEYVNQVPYQLEVKLPGHAAIIKTGDDPQDLFLSLHLQQDKSVVFNKKWTNSLGEELIPLRRVLVMKHEVCLKHYRQFAHETNTPMPPAPNFEQAENHPVVNITRDEARAFAKWLTEKERKEKLIGEHDFYRLPFDAEWNAMNGLENESGASPFEKSLQSQHKSDYFSWGNTWPPKNNTGNFADESALSHLASSRHIVGYNDSFPYTAPVGSFAKNHLGICDLDGNVMEWLENNYGGPEKLAIRHYGVARGGSFLSFRPNQLTPIQRNPLPETTRDVTLGFRLVLSSKRPNK